MSQKVKSVNFCVKGMHCASCEILIEKKLLEIKEVKSVEASTAKENVVIVYQEKRPTVKKLNKLFAQYGYSFSEPLETKTPGAETEMENAKTSNASTNYNELLQSLLTGLLIIAAFLIFIRLGLSELINVSSSSSLPMFFAFGFIAGLSSCAALVGGIILSMSKQWHELYAHDDSTWKKIQPHLTFNLGRIISYGVFGALLGAIGSQFNLSLTFGSFLVIAVSLLMIFSAFQMLGWKKFNKFQLTMPKFVTSYIADESNFKNRLMPLIMGALTFFLPCGFTITAQGLALISGSALQGGLIMSLFALGTAPSLLGIGLSSIKFCQKPFMAKKFTRVAGILVLFFAFYNINFQLNVLGLPSFSDLGRASFPVFQAEHKQEEEQEENLAPIVDGKQVLTMAAGSYSYSPDYLKVRAGMPVRWKVADEGISGCTDAIIARGLFKGEFPLKREQVNIKEFTPEEPGTYKFSCWMGMVSGVIEVIE